MLCCYLIVLYCFDIVLYCGLYGIQSVFIVSHLGDPGKGRKAGYNILYNIYVHTKQKVSQRTTWASPLACALNSSSLFQGVPNCLLSASFSLSFLPNFFQALVTFSHTFYHFLQLRGCMCHLSPNSEKWSFRNRII